METKICTTIEQSDILIKLGLDKSTADMHYFSDGYNPTRLDIGFDESTSKFYRGTKNKYTPAWSYMHLFSMLPKINGKYPKLLSARANKDKHYYVTYDLNWYPVTKGSDDGTPESAIYNAIRELLENGVMNKNKTNKL